MESFKFTLAKSNEISILQPKALKRYLEILGSLRIIFREREKLKMLIPNSWQRFSECEEIF